jgi:hypothetical protein
MKKLRMLTATQDEADQQDADLGGDLFACASLEGGFGWLLRIMRDRHFTADGIARENGIDLPGFISAGERDALRSEGRAVNGIRVSDARLPAKHHLHGVGSRDPAGGRWPGRARLSHLDILPRLIKREREDDEEDESEHIERRKAEGGRRKLLQIVLFRRVLTFLVIVTRIAMSSLVSSRRG